MDCGEGKAVTKLREIEKSEVGQISRDCPAFSGGKVFANRKTGQAVNGVIKEDIL
jgi:hypothetical protein